MKRLPAATLALALVACPAAESPRPTPPAAAVTPSAESAPATARGEGSEARLEAGPPVRVAFVARDGFHVNEEYPVAFTPAGGARLALKDRLTFPRPRGPEGHLEAQAELPEVSPGPDGRVAGVLAFSVCAAEKCLIEKVSLAVAAKAPVDAPR